MGEGQRGRDGIWLAVAFYLQYTVYFRSTCATARRTPQYYTVVINICKYRHGNQFSVHQVSTLHQQYTASGAIFISDYMIALQHSVNQGTSTHTHTYIYIYRHTHRDICLITVLSQDSRTLQCPHSPNIRRGCETKPCSHIHRGLPPQMCFKHINIHWHCT